MVTIFFGEIIISFSFLLGDYGVDIGMAQRCISAGNAADTVADG